MDAKKISYVGLVVIALAILPPTAENLLLAELLAILVLILGLVARWKGDKHGGLLITIMGLILIVQKFLIDIILNVLKP